MTETNIGRPSPLSPSFQVVTCKAAKIEKLSAGEERNMRFPWMKERAHRLGKG